MLVEVRESARLSRACAILPNISQFRCVVILRKSSDFFQHKRSPFSRKGRNLPRLVLKSGYGPVKTLLLRAKALKGTALLKNLQDLLCVTDKGSRGCHNEWPLYPLVNETLFLNYLKAH